MMAGSSPAGRPGWLIVAAPTLLLLTPFVIFVRHHAYPLHSPEILGCVLLLSVVGGTLGALAYRFPAVAPLVMAGSIVGLVDLQFYVPVPIEGIGETTALLAGLVVLAAVLRYSPGRTLTSCSSSRCCAGPPF